MSTAEMRDRYNKLVEKSTALTNNLTSLESRLEVLREEEVQVVTKLEEQFGVSGLAAAEALLQERTARLEEQLAECERGLADD